MSKVTLLYVFENPKLEQLTCFIDQLIFISEDRFSFKIGIISESIDAGTIEPYCTRFVEKTSVSQAFNQLAAASDADVLILNHGVVLPLISDSGWKALEGIQSNSLVILDGRRQVGTIQGGVHPLSVSVWREFEFSRNVHAESPLAIVVRREDFLHVRGFDERKAFQTVHVMDLLARLRRIGVLEVRPSEPQTYVMDVRNTFPLVPVAAVPDSISVRENEKAQVLSDQSIYRNLDTWSVPRAKRPVLVSVAIATRDRGEYLTDSINSVLAQTFEDFELIIVDDGSEDDTRDVVESVQDDRVKYLRQNPTGISSARNLAADNSRGHFTAVHDDDDIMLPWRLSTSLAAISATERASYGSWVNFDDVSGDMVLHITKKSFGRDLVAYSGQTPGHATWLLPTAVIRHIRYDETLSSSVDHNLAVRTAMSGLSWKHSGQVLFLRRLHPTQVSQTDSKRQLAAAVLTRYANSFSADIAAQRTMTGAGKSLDFPKPADKAKLFQTFGAYLPDHLVERSMRIQGLVGKKVLALDLHDRFTFIASETDLLTGRSTLELGGADRISWNDIVEIRRQGLIGCTYTASRKKAPDAINDLPPVEPYQNVINSQLARAFNTVQKISTSSALIVIRTDSISRDSLDDARGLLLAKHFSINHGDYERDRFVLLGFKTLNLSSEFLAKSNFDKNDYEIHLNSSRILSDINKVTFFEEIS